MHGCFLWYDVSYMGASCVMRVSYMHGCSMWYEVSCMVLLVL